MRCGLVGFTFAQVPMEPLPKKTSGIFIDSGIIGSSRRGARSSDFGSVEFLLWC
jgi:hypothetical protein